MENSKSNNLPFVLTNEENVSVKEKQIEEMVHLLNMGLRPAKETYGTDEIAKILYNAGYRKQSVGHWVIIEYDYFTCSECGEYYPSDCDYTQQAKERVANGDVPNFCPNCGAKMKGGE